MTTFERKAVILELAILTVTLILTSVIGYAVFRQTTNHFAIQRTTYMIERFNQKDLVNARDITDKWLRNQEDPKALMDRAKDFENESPDPAKTETEQISI